MGRHNSGSGRTTREGTEPGFALKRMTARQAIAA